MKKFIFYTGIFVSIFALISSCSEVFFEDDPVDSPENNFEIFWQDYNRNYSFFELKKIDWDSIYRVKKPLVNSKTSQTELFKILGDIVLSLQDGHAGLNSKTLGTVSFDYTRGAPENKLKSVSNYVSLKRLNNLISFGVIDNNIGYISILNFINTEPLEKFEAIDEVIKDFNEKNLKGIIIDIRNNPGGNQKYSMTVSSRFYDKNRIFSYIRWKNGPDYNDFSKWNSISNKPVKNPYLKPVILLTNRKNYSTGESFILEMKVLPHVTIVGDTTGGGSGYPLTHHLPNGWSYTVPRWQQVDAEKRIYEGIGLIPNIPVWISQEDIKNNRDAILERAILELNK
jgi:carboxyl-terminal processing protease